MTVKIHPRLWSAISDWCDERTKAVPSVAWEGKHPSEKLESVVIALWPSQDSLYYQHGEQLNRNAFVIVHDSEVPELIRRALRDRSTLRLTDISGGHGFFIDAAGWAEDPDEICISGSGAFERMVRTLPDAIRSGTIVEPEA